MHPFIEKVNALAVAIGNSIQLRGFKLGGTTGQVPIKNSNTDFDWSWGTPSGGGGGSMNQAEITAAITNKATFASDNSLQVAGSYATAEQGTDERVPTAAGLTAKFSTAETSVVDTDRIATFDAGASFTPKHATLTTLWTWIKEKIDAGMIIAGAQTFSGQVQLAAGQAATDAQSAMSRGLADARYLIVIAKKSSAQMDVTSSTTYVDITGLTSYSLEANTVYRMEFSGSVTVGSTGGAKIQMVSSTALFNTASHYLGTAFNANGSVQNIQQTSSTTITLFSRNTAASTAAPLMGYLLFRTGASAPNIKFQFAQVASDANTSSLLAGAVASITKIA